jgi:ribosomal protein S18 acetylase RimI-like enzyme
LLAEHVRDETSRYLGFSVGTIDLVATVPEYRNNGVATTLVSSTLDLFRNRGARVAELTVHSTDTPSAHVYQSQGFVTVGSALTLTNWRR